jgi:HD superfamily phosphohydrolase
MLFKCFPFYVKVAFFNFAYSRVKDKSEFLNENLLIKTEGVNEIERFLTSQLKTIT